MGGLDHSGAFANGDGFGMEGNSSHDVFVISDWGKIPLLSYSPLGLEETRM